MGFPVEKQNEIIRYPERVHITKPVFLTPQEEASEMIKADQDMGEWMVSFAKAKGLTLTKAKNNG